MRRSVLIKDTSFEIFADYIYIYVSQFRASIVAMSFQNGQPEDTLGITGIYSVDVKDLEDPEDLEEISPCGGDGHPGSIFVPICFICGVAIGRSVSGGLWIDCKPPGIHIQELDVAWTQQYRASKFFGRFYSYSLASSLLF